MLASVQKSGKAHTNATELRENRLAITENTEKKDVYLSPVHVNLFMGVKKNYLEAYFEICQAENVVSRRNTIINILIRILISVIQFAAYSGVITRLYMSIYERMERCSIGGRDVG